MGTEVSGEFTEKLGPPPPLRSQEAQPHFPSARVPFRPPELGTLGRPPRRRAGGYTQPGRGAGHTRPSEAMGRGVASCVGRRTLQWRRRPPPELIHFSSV